MSLGQLGGDPPGLRTLLTCSTSCTQFGPTPPQVLSCHRPSGTSLQHPLPFQLHLLYLLLPLPRLLLRKTRASWSTFLSSSLKAT